MKKVTKMVELTISNMFTGRLALIFDGHNTPESHCVAFFATFPATCQKRYEEIFLTMSPIEEKTSQNADNTFPF